MSEWQLIETAPQDETLLIYLKRPSRSLVAYDIGELQSGMNRWYDASGHELELYDWRVTHWMPLPEPPK